MNKNFNIAALVRKNIAEMEPYSSARDEFKDFGKDLVFLDANENPFETEVNRYPDPQQRDLKALLSSQKGVASDSILLGNGSDEVLDLIIRAFCEPNRDSTITLPPTYGMYKVLAATNAVANHEILLDGAWEPNVATILELQNERTKLLFLCSPNNPTGNSYSEEKVEQLLLGFNGIVVLDEAYIDFSERSSWLLRLSEFPNLIITQTLSKAYGMAGIRLGICYASPEIISVLNKIKPPYNVNELTQQRASLRLTNLDEVKNEIALIKDSKRHLTKALLEVKYVIEVFKSDANFVLVRVDDASKRYRQLLEHGIVVRNRSTQPLCKNTLRFTVGTNEETETLIQTLKSLE